MTAKAKANYSEASIGVLKGLDPVRHRPGMYTNTEDPNHIAQEVIDNANDEAQGGHATRVSVELHEDGSVSIEDNGRGIPPGIHPIEKKSTLELIFTSLHSGGKFNKEGEDSAYGFAGGLHGVGVSVTNALSSRLEATVWRDGYEHAIAFENGDVVTPVAKKKLPADEKDKHGTRVRFWINPKYFENPAINTAKMERYLRSKAVLTPGVELSWTRPGKPPMVWTFERGMSEYLEQEVAEQGTWAAPLFNNRVYQEASGNGVAEGEGFELALGWLADGRAIRESYVNLIPTTEGGKHESGLRAGMFEAVRNAADRSGAIPRGVELSADDVWARASFVLAARFRDPQFQNQTKDRLVKAKSANADGNDIAHRVVQTGVRDTLELWLNDHPTDARAIIDVVVQEAVRRSKAAVKVDRRKGTGNTVLPGKLADCELRDVEQTELFLVEGDSAGGSAKEGRDKSRQAILPLRGKLLNTWEEDTMKILQSETISNIASAVGVDPHPDRKAADTDLSGLRYGRVVILADADVDGQHIQTLLLTLFYKHFPALIERGHIWIAQPPLYRIDAPAKRGGKGAGSGPRKMYALDERELKEIQASLTKEGVKETQWTISRFKGLGEMNPQQLRETTMDPANRRMLCVRVPDPKAATAQFELMMGKKNAEQRKAWMEKKGPAVEINE